MPKNNQQFSWSFCWLFGEYWLPPQTIEVDHKGKQQKRYYQKNMMTSLDKLKSLPNAQQYLKPGMTFDTLDQLAAKQSDLDAWAQLQKARTKLFDSIFGQTPEAA